MSTSEIGRAVAEVRGTPDAGAIRDDLAAQLDAISDTDIEFEAYVDGDSIVIIKLTTGDFTLRVDGSAISSTGTLER